MGCRFDQGGSSAGHSEGLFDRLGIRAGAVDREREPERKSPGPAAEMVCIVAGVPFAALVDRLEVAGLLRVGAPCVVGVPVQQGRAVVRSEEPLVRVHDQGVAVLYPVEEVANRPGGEAGCAVGTVDVEPERVCGGNRGHLVEGVDHTKVGRSGGGDYSEHLGSLGTCRDCFGHGITPEPPVRACRGKEDVDVHHPCRRAHRGVGIL